MIPYLRSFQWLVAAVLAACLPHAEALTFSPGDIYTANYFLNTITHVRGGTSSPDTLNLDNSYGSDVRGLSFGQDGLLYAVTTRGTGFGVVAIDSAGTVVANYDGDGYVGGNISFGKIAFGNNDSFYVAGPSGLSSFSPGHEKGSLINGTNSLFDVKVMPSGDLLALSGYGLQELSPTGGLVRTINTSIRLVDARGIEFDPLTGDIFVTMLGDSNASFQLMRFDGSTGLLERNVSFIYGDDMTLLANGTLLVGSRTQAPGIFDLDLNRIGTLGIQQQMFVTQMPVPEPETAVLMVGGILLLLVREKRRARE